MRRYLTEAAFHIPLWTWGLAPLLVFFLAKVHPGFCNRHPYPVVALLVLWATMALAVFCNTLKGPQSLAVSSLVCTIFLGLPSIALSSLSLYGSPFNLLANLSTGGGNSTLEPVEAPPVPERTLYVAAIDLSTQAVGTGEERLRRLDQIDRAMKSIFLNPDANSFTTGLRAQDLLHVYVVAGSYHADWTNQLGGEANENRRNSLIKELRARIGQVGMEGEEIGESSNTFELLSTICSDISSSTGYTRAKVVLFSNWTPAPELPQTAQETELTKIEETVHDHGLPTSLLGFCMQPAQPPGSPVPASCGGVVHALHSRFNGDEWQEVDLAAYDQWTADEKTMALETLFSHLEDAPPLYIKYFPALRANSPSSFLTLPGNTLKETMVLKLHSLAEGQSPLRLDFAAPAAGDFILSLPAGDHVKVLGPRIPNLMVKLEDHSQRPQDKEFELLVAIPRRSLLYRIPLIIMPVLSDPSTQALFFTAFIMHLLPVILAFHIYRLRRDSPQAATQP